VKEAFSTDGDALLSTMKKHDRSLRTDHRRSIPRDPGLAPVSRRPGTVYLLDDDADTVKALTRLLCSLGFEVRGFTSAHAFFASFRSDETACLVLDVAMPELDGLELQRRLADQGILIPIIFLSGHGDIPMSVRAIKAGATDFLTKPVDAVTLVEAVGAALELAATRQQQSAELAAWSARLATLTPREREVMQHVVAGQLNKQIAADLGTGEQNIKLHRAHIMKKMGSASVAELVRAAERLGLAKAVTPHSPQNGFNGMKFSGALQSRTHLLAGSTP